MGHTWLPQQSQRRLEDAECGPDVMAIGGDDRVLAAVVSAKQLVGTIQEVETHEIDPTRDEDGDPWSTFHDEFGGLGERIKDTYRRVATEGGPSEEEIKDAFGTLLGAWDRVAESVSTALQDPDVRQKLKAAAGSFVTAVGTTIGELATDLVESERWKPTKPDNDTGEGE
jgi:hypothetical protein